MKRIIRNIVDNVLSGTKAGFKSILNFEHAIERKKMDHQKSKSTFSAILLSLTLMVAALGVSSAVGAEKKMVKDPTTGKMVSAPEYGGTFRTIRSGVPAHIDPYYHYFVGAVIALVNEKLGIADWALDRSKFSYATLYLPDFTIKGRLAESWEIPDPLTYVIKIRQGVHWHKKAPMRGRALTAKDIEFNFHRLFGIGSGFTEMTPDAGFFLKDLQVESIRATDDATVVFKLKAPRLGLIKDLFTANWVYIVAPEVVKEHGNVSDWRNVVGTGPYELTNVVEGASYHYVKNPNYWGHDEKYPQNQLPYFDEINIRVSKEVATNLALLRSGKVDFLGMAGDTQLISMDQVESMQRTNPEIKLYPYAYRAETGLTFNTQNKPWNDIRVRRAIQMAIDYETINQTYFKGFANTTPVGHIGFNVVGYFKPSAEWPEAIKQYYRYDPEAAGKLLDEAGYPKGADGIRFKTRLDHNEAWDLNYYEVAMAYLEQIGIDVEIIINDYTTFVSGIRDHTHTGLFNEVTGADYPSALAPITQAHSEAGWNPPNVKDAQFDELLEKAQAATTQEEQQKWAREADWRIIEQNWWVYGPRVPMFHVSQPWVKGFNGEVDLGGIDRTVIFARLWFDHDLKKEMGQ